MYQDDGQSSATSSRLQVIPMMEASLRTGSSRSFAKELKSEERGLYLIHLLLTCANHVAAGSLESAEVSLGQISQLASPDGDTMQRIAAYFTEALAYRIIKAWPGVEKALNGTKLNLFSEELLVRKLFLEMFPFLKVAFLLSNQAILEAMEGEKMVHVIDLHANEPAQWIALLHSLSSRREGPPHLRITGVHQQKEVLDQMAHKLIEEAEKLDVPFQFNAVVTKLENLDMEKLRVKSGEALAMSSILQLHPLLSFESEVNRRHSHIESFLQSLWSLSPKIMIVTERDSNHNGVTFMERLLEALYYYAAFFDCLESTMSRSSLERLKLEKMMFGEEIKNIVACEGAERKQRHEKVEKWAQRLQAVGFRANKFSYYGIMQATILLKSYACEGYKIKEVNGGLVICWQDRSLFSVSAWKCRI